MSKKAKRMAVVATCALVASGMFAAHATATDSGTPSACDNTSASEFLADGQIVSALLSPPEDNEFEPNITFLDDINGDGIADYAIWDPSISHAGVPVVLFCGSTDEPLHVLRGRPDDANFGLIVLHAGDVNGDGHQNIAVGTLLDTDGCDCFNLYFFIYCANTGLPVAIVQGEQADEETLFTLNSFHIADVTMSGSVTHEDVLAVINALGTTNLQDTMLDVNLDQTIDLIDLDLIIASIGSSNNDHDLSTLHAGITDEIDNIIIIDDDEEFFVGCVWCMLNCGKALSQARDCVRQKRQAECACYDLPDLFDVAACVEDVRVNFLPNCLAQIAAAAGSCGQCVLSCGPKIR